MSIAVDLDKLAEALGGYSFAYLVTVGDDYRAHTVAVDPMLVGTGFVLDSAGNRTRKNASAHPEVSLVWPPQEPGGYTLIVDGTATSSGDGLRIVPTGAVLHRKPGPDAPPSASACGDDCVPLSG